jgi:trans-aconitate methyltransferase
MRAGRKLFWSLRPASMANSTTVPVEFIALVTEWIPDVTVPFRLVEVGCGDGRVLRCLAKRYPQAQFRGIDLQRAAISLGTKSLATSGHDTPMVQLVCGSCLDDGISLGCDYLISRAALIYLNQDEIRTFLRKRLPQIGKGGILQEVVSTTGRTERSHFYAHPLAELIEEIAPGQFTLTQVVLGYGPWKSEKWTGVNLILIRNDSS